MTGKVAAVVVAAGRGERAGGDMPKQYRDIAGEPMIRPTLSSLPRSRRRSTLCNRSSNPDDDRPYRAAVAGLEKLAAARPGRCDAAGFGARRA